MPRRRVRSSSRVRGCLSGTSRRKPDALTAGQIRAGSVVHSAPTAMQLRGTDILNALLQNGAIYTFPPSFRMSKEQAGGEPDRGQAGPAAFYFFYSKCTVNPYFEFRSDRAPELEK